MDDEAIVVHGDYCALKKPARSKASDLARKQRRCTTGEHKKPIRATIRLVQIPIVFQNFHVRHGFWSQAVLGLKHFYGRAVFREGYIIEAFDRDLQARRQSLLPERG